MASMDNNGRNWRVYFGTSLENMYKRIYNDFLVYTMFILRNSVVFIVHSVVRNIPSYD